MSKQICTVGGDGFTFEMVIDGAENGRYLEPTPLISRRDREFGEVEVKNGKIHICICLPKLIRNDNINPFSITDMMWLELMIDDIEWALRQALKGIIGDDDDVLGAFARTIECNLTQPVAGESTCAQVLNLINRSFHEGTNTVYQRASSKCRYLKEDETVIVRKKNYYVLKCYDKSLQQREGGNTDVEDGLLRIEVVMLGRVINNLFYGKSTIRDVLSKQGLMKAIVEYKRIFIEEIVNGHIIPCLDDVTDILFESLKETNSQVETIAIHKELIMDEEILRKALVKWYRFKGYAEQEDYNEERARRNTDAYICRAKKKHDFPKNVIDTIREFKRSCG